MKLQEHRKIEFNLIGRYGDGSVVIHGEEIRRPCIVAAGLRHTDWIASLEELNRAALAPVWSLEPRIVLLGATPAPAFSTALRELRSDLTARQAALEIMDLGAACRTYNVLAQEERAVIALLFP
jgi:uncharacterized protein